MRGQFTGIGTIIQTPNTLKPQKSSRFDARHMELGGSYPGTIWLERAVEHALDSPHGAMGGVVLDRGG